MSNVLCFERKAVGESPSALVSRRSSPRSLGAVERSLRKVFSEDPDVMFGLFARVVEHYAGDNKEPAPRGPRTEQALDEILLMISLEMHQQAFET